LGVKLNAVATLTVQIAKEALVPAAEREEGHWRGNANIDANVAGVCLVPELTGAGATAGKNASHIAVAAFIDPSMVLVRITLRTGPKISMWAISLWGGT
jgi:hypothetical protein